MTSLKSAIANLKKATINVAKAVSSKKTTRRKKRRNCSNPENPRIHFPKTKRGRPSLAKFWTISGKGVKTVRFKAKKADAYSRAKKLAKTHGHVVLDGPK